MPVATLQVTLVGPLPGERWVSIQRYVEAILALSGQDGLEVEVAPTLPDASYSPIGAYRARYRRLPHLLRSARDRDRLVHIADQALGHLVDCFPGNPTVVTCHDLMPLLNPDHYGARFERWFDGHLLRKSLDGMATATRIIAVSRFTAGGVTEVLGIEPARISVVPNMLNAAYAPHKNAEDWLALRWVALPPGPRVLSVCHTRPAKDVERLLAAMGAPELRAASLVRVGGALTVAQRDLAGRAGIDGRLVELGHLEPPLLARVYAACDVLAQPSRSEGFGVPVVEAMACGLPVVCSDGGALPEVAGYAAVVVPVASRDEPRVEDLALALTRVLRDAALASKLRRKGLARAQAFRPEAVLPGLLRAYTTAIEEHYA